MVYFRYFCVCFRFVVSNAYCVVPFVFLRLMYTMLQASLDCPFLIAPSVFSTVYLLTLIIWTIKNIILITGVRI